MLGPCRLVWSDYRPVRQRGTRPRHLYVPCCDLSSMPAAGEGEWAVLALDLVVWLARAADRAVW